MAFPVNIMNMHWTLAVLEPRALCAYWLDPLKSGDPAFLQAIVQWYCGVAAQRGRPEHADPQQWALFYNDGAQRLISGAWCSLASPGTAGTRRITYPKQRNGVDCGVLVLMMLECIMQGAPIAFNVSDAALATRMRHALALWLCGNPG